MDMYSYLTLIHRVVTIYQEYYYLVVHDRSKFARLVLVALSTYPPCNSGSDYKTRRNKE